MYAEQVFGEGSQAPSPNICSAYLSSAACAEESFHASIHTEKRSFHASVHTKEGPFMHRFTPSTILVKAPETHMPPTPEPWI